MMISGKISDILLFLSCIGNLIFIKIVSRKISDILLFLLCIGNLMFIKIVRFSQRVIENRYWRLLLSLRNPKKRKQIEWKEWKKWIENVQPSKGNRNDITLFCWVHGDGPATKHAMPIKVGEGNTIGELKDLIGEKIHVPIMAKDIKLWKVEIPDDRDDELTNFPFRDHDELLATHEIGEYWKRMPPKRHIHIIIDLKMDPLKQGIDGLLNDHNIDKLCLYVESKLREWIKRGDLYEDRELVTKALFHALLSDIPNYSVETEVPIYHNGWETTLYGDLLMVKTSAKNGKRDRFIFEFKNKGVNHLDLGIKGYNKNWEVMEQRANKVETMPRDDVRRLKCVKEDRYNKDETVEKIFNDGREQLLNYVRSLGDGFHTSAFVVMSVGSRRLIWEKIN